MSKNRIKSVKSWTSGDPNPYEDSFEDFYPPKLQPVTNGAVKILTKEEVREMLKKTK